MRRSERCHRHHRTVGSTHKEQVEITRTCAVSGIGLQIHTVDAVEHIEIVDINRPGESLHCRKYVADRNPLHLGLVAVHIKKELRNLGLQRGGQAGKFRTLSRIELQCVHGLLKIRICGVTSCLEHHLETTRRAESGHDGRREKVNVAFGIC